MCEEIMPSGEVVPALCNQFVFITSPCDQFFSFLWFGYITNDADFGFCFYFLKI